MVDDGVTMVMGKVTAVRKDKKGLQLDNGEWYSQFGPVNCSRGDEVSIDYVVHGNFKNIKKLLITKKTESPDVPIGESAKLRRITDCIIAAKDLAVAGKIPIDKIAETAKGFVNLIHELENTDKVIEGIVNA